MKRCPKCGATTSGDDAFCEADGGRLVDEAPPPAAAAGAACPQCGAANADAGDGYCSACGHKLDEGRTTPPLVPLGAMIGGGEVIAARAPDEFAVRRASGETITVRVGTDAEIARELAATRALGDAPPFPKLLENGADPRHGSFLALSAPSADARPIAQAARGATLPQMLDLLRQGVDAADRAERAGFAWEPEPEDLYVDGSGKLALSRVRVARALSSGARLAAKRVTEAVGGAFAPEPASRGPARLLHLVLPSRMADESLATIDQVRAELAAIEAALPVPPDDARRVGGVCDPGLRRDHNEDAYAVAAGETNGEPWTVIVVCDGVSSSTHAEQASTIAAKTAKDALAHFARSGDIAYESAIAAMATAIRAAHLAVCAQKIDHAKAADPPGTTIVAGLVFKRRLTVGWVGDSRAYWVSERGSELLTRDHSWANEAVERGEMSEAEAMQAPLAHALTKCLGPLEVGDEVVEIDPDVRARDLPGRGHIVLCSDGLWNYYPQAADVAALVHAVGPAATPAAIARALVNQALARGGQDNVTVAVYAHD